SARFRAAASSRRPGRAGASAARNAVVRGRRDVGAGAGAWRRIVRRGSRGPARRRDPANLPQVSSMRSFDFSSWQSVLSTLGGLVLFALVVVGVRLLFMQTIQRRRERENRQINERLKTL